MHVDLSSPQQWVAYSQEASALLEEAYASGMNGGGESVLGVWYFLFAHDTGQQKVNLIINDQSFTVHIDQMKQFNQVQVYRYVSPPQIGPKTYK